MNKKRLIILIVALLVIDQVTKILVKTNMTLDQSITVFSDWFFIRFIENPGAAFGIAFGGDMGKLILSLFRIAVSGLIIWYLRNMLRSGAPAGIIIGFGLMLAGAIGNILDSIYFGVIFSESTYTTVATMFPEGGGYAGFLHGHVVDMLYFPLFHGHYPSWLPSVGGNPFTFFSPIFNFADSYITVGTLYMLFFQRKYFMGVQQEEDVAMQEEQE